MRDLTEDKSEFLHLLRWSAALVVVIGHAQMYLESVSGISAPAGSLLRYVGAHAHAAVMVFFVLSGFVVAYATERKCAVDARYGLREYFIDRWSRIYSVLLPAILLTALIDWFARGLPAFQNPTLIPQDHHLLRLLVNLAGLQGLFGYRIQYGSNAALWSIGYELTFYLLWGLWYFRDRGAHGKLRLLLGVAILAVMGWRVAYYFALWLLGVVAWRHYRNRSVNLRFPVLIALPLLALGNDVVNYRMMITRHGLINDGIFALLVAGIIALDSSWPRFARGPHLSVNHHLAEFSYSVYAYHLPLIFVMCALLPCVSMPLSYEIYMVGLVMSSILAARAFYPLTEGRRGFLRAQMSRLVPG